MAYKSTYTIFVLQARLREGEDWTFSPQASSSPTPTSTPYGPSWATPTPSLTASPSQTSAQATPDVNIPDDGPEAPDDGCTPSPYGPACHDDAEAPHASAGWVPWDDRTTAWQNQRNDLCSQQRLRSASSLCAWRNLGSLATHWATHWAHSEDSDQTGRMARLIWVFAGCTGHFIVMRRVRIYNFEHRQNCCNYPKIWTIWFYHVIMLPI